MTNVPNTWQGVSNYAASVGSKFPDLVAAQWALESGFGQHAPGHNYFGLKGFGTAHETKEFYDGQWVTVKAGFLVFPSLAVCIEYLVSHWYKDWRTYKGINRADNQYAGARMLKDQGYATDPDYAIKLSTLMKAHAPEAKKMTLIGPKKNPKDFGFSDNDYHLIVNDQNEKVKAFNAKGELLWEFYCLARGQGSDYEWKLTNTDTPPGLYKIGAVYRDYENDPSATYSREKMSYGWYSFDLIDLEGQENKNGRAGIMIHGGGSACGWPGAWAAYQKLYSTHGCVRMHNQHLKDYLLPLTEKGDVFVSVYQELP
jgi:hypothetical protein